MYNPLHYYGDLVRKFFIGGAILMLLTLPFINALLPISLFYSLLAIIVINMVAGFTSPNKPWAIVLDEIVAVIAVLVFEYFAVKYYTAYGTMSALFIINQILALNFLIALYYNTKTLRKEPMVGEPR